MDKVERYNFNSMYLFALPLSLDNSIEDFWHGFGRTRALSQIIVLAFALLRRRHPLCQQSPRSPWAVAVWLRMVPFVRPPVHW